MPLGGSHEETLPTIYGLVIAFLAGLLGYVLWVSSDAHYGLESLFFPVFYQDHYVVELKELNAKIRSYD